MGTVALLNSLRLTGHEGELVVLDCGLTASQRDRLAPHCRVESAHRETGNWGYPLKPFAWRPETSTSVAVMVDSDIIVTDSLESLLQDAAQGKIAMFVDLMALLGDPPGRLFTEWQHALGLASPPRPQPYLNCGLIAFSVTAWPDLLARWVDACRLAAHATISEGEPRRPWPDNPFAFPEQDAFNAILMSEVPPAAIAPRDYELAPITQREAVRVEDPARLRCVNLGRQTLLLHNTARPKAWERRAWAVAPYRAFAELLPRILFGADVPLRLERADVPAWLRPGLGGRAAELGTSSARGLLRLGSMALPSAVKTHFRSLLREWAAPEHVS